MKGNKHAQSKVLLTPCLDMTKHNLSDDILAAGIAFYEKLERVKANRNEIDLEIRFWNGRIQDLMHTLQIGNGKLKAQALAKIAKALADARESREALNRERLVLMAINRLISSNKLLQCTSTLNSNLNADKKGFSERKYSLRTMSLAEIKNLTNIDMSEFGMEETNPDKVYNA